MTPAELNYSAFDRELLAAYLAVRHFQYFVEGRVFHINTDQKSLTFALQGTTERRSPRQARHLAFISEFTNDIRHIEGLANPVADALSRNVLVLEQSPVDLETLAVAQSQDEDLKSLFTSSTFLQLKQVPIPHSNKTLLCDVSLGRPRPLVPSTMRRAVFDNLHSLSHPGITASRRLVSERYVWPNMKRDIATWNRTCHDCQQSKVDRHIKAPLQTFPAPDSRFDRFMSISLVLCLLPRATLTCSPALIGIPAGRKPFQCVMPRLNSALPPSCPDGSHALVCQERSPPTGE